MHPFQTKGYCVPIILKLRPGDRGILSGHFEIGMVRNILYCLTGDHSGIIPGIPPTRGPTRLKALHLEEQGRIGGKITFGKSSRCGASFDYINFRVKAFKR